MIVGYSVGLLFNKEFDAYVRTLWQGCAKNNLSDYMLQIKGDAIPHVALSVYENIEDSDIVPLFKKYKNINEKKADFESNSVCLFKSTNVIYINVNVNRNMLNYFENVYHFFVNLADKCSPYYLPYSIIPHISIARCNNFEHTKKCWSYVADKFEHQKLMVEKIALFRLYFDDEKHSLKKCKLLDEKILIE